MRLKSFLEKTFLGETLVERLNSPINGEISVYDGWFGRSMRIGGITQSGELVEKLWKIALKQIFNFQFSIFNQFSNSNFQILILGLGCGNAAKLISKKWPEAKISGIEIDPKVIEVGKKYFGLEKINNLKVIIGDATRQGDSLSPQGVSLHNLILVDLYLGQNYPKEAESEEFIGGVKKLLDEDGVAIFNRLSYGEYDKPANEFAEKLHQFFPKVQTKKAVTNLLIFCGQSDKD